MKYGSDGFMKIYLIITTLFIIIFSFSPSSAIEKSDAYNIPEKYRIEVISAGSSNNAIKIAEKLNNIFNKPVYISSAENKYKILIGGIETEEEALAIKKKLNELGIITPIIIKTVPLPVETGITGPFPSGKELNLHATHINSNIKIDGILDEPDWEKTSAYDGYFFQQQPFDRIPSSDKTSVKILVDNGNLYFGISCICAEPHKIIAKAMRRDAMLWSDDYVELFLDTYHDGRNSFYFSTNPLEAPKLNNPAL